MASNGKPVQINLNGNSQLTKLNQAAFQSVLDYFEQKNYDFTGLEISLTGGNSICALFVQFHIII